MKSNFKKISIVLYCNNNFDETKESLYSIIDQKISNLFYEVLILNDNAQSQFTKKINDFIKKEELTNFFVFSFAQYTGLPLTFNFLIYNNIIKSDYVTIVKSGDTLKDGWINYFLVNLLPLGYDLYMSDVKDWLYIPKKSIDTKGKLYSVSKSRLIISPIPSGEISQNEAICTKPIFLGKIWKTSNVKNIRLDDNKILYQDIFMYMQMILFSTKIWYENVYSGIVRRKPWLPEQMDKERINLLSNTLNKMISRNEYMNGHVLQLLYLALQRTQDEDRKLYLLSNYKYLQNYEIVPFYGISRRKIIKLTSPFIKYGEIKIEEKEPKRKLKNKKIVQSLS